MQIRDVTRNWIGSGKLSSQSYLMYHEIFHHYKKGLLNAEVQPYCDYTIFFGIIVGQFCEKETSKPYQ